VDELVEASRHLAREEFDYRVQDHRRDEFGELARAMNHLAEQLQTNEQRKMETLQQVALTLNHELNNAASIIGLQLEKFARSSGGDPRHSQQLREIRKALERMTGIAEALKRVRRIVLTEYVGGLKMLDLEQSLQADDAEPPVPAAPSGRSIGG
jgi:signal transduction histidine kinase